MTEIKHHQYGIYLTTFLIRAFWTGNVLLLSMGFDRTIQRRRGKKLRYTCRFRVRCYYLRIIELNPAYTSQYSSEITIGEDEYNTKYNDVYLSTAAQLGL